MEDMLRNPLELLDQDLDVVAGGGPGINVDVNVNVAAINQLILQVEVGGSHNIENGANVVTIMQL